MSVTINTNYNAYNSGVTRTLQPTKANDAEAPQTLENFKRNIYDTINKMQIHPSQSKTQICVNISDKAFEKMMTDPEYKNEMMRVIQRDLNGAYPFAAAPSYSVIRIGDDCEYYADAMGSAYGDYYSGYKATSFWERAPQKSGSDEYSRKQYAIDQDFATKRLMERRIRQEALRDQELEMREQAKKLEQAALQYENSVFMG